MGSDLPNPGSKEAIEQGCKCPVIDNNRGAGIPDADGKVNFFWYSSDCELHCSKVGW